MEEIIKYIEDNNLRKKSRKREILYPRYYLYNKLREQGYPFDYIASLFDQTHGTVMNGIRNHKIYTSMNDKLYFIFTEKERSIFNDVQVIRSLKEEVLDCYDMKSLSLIKKRIKLNLYEYL